MSTTNEYEKKRKKMQALSGTKKEVSTMTTGERLKHSGIETAKHVGSALGGGFAGAAMGRWSLLTGLAVSGVGAYLDSPYVITFGVGMLASNAVPLTGLEGTDDKKSAFQKASDRIKGYGKGIMNKLFIDKFKKKPAAANTSTTSTTTTTETSTSENVSGTEKVQYLTYPPSDKPDAFDMSELERYEKQVQESAEVFSQNEKTTTTTETPVSGLENELNFDEKII